MAGSPRIVTEDTTFTWDHAVQRLARGTLLDVPPGGALEAAIGAGRLIPAPGSPPAPPPLTEPARIITEAKALTPARAPAPRARTAGKRAAP